MGNPLKRFALPLWQLNCRFAASSAPKLTTVFIDQRILEVMKKEANNMQLAMVGLCVGWKVYKAGWKVCCWKVCWWQLAMAGLCGVVEWAMKGAYVHLVSTSGVWVLLSHFVFKITRSVLLVSTEEKLCARSESFQ